ncbi:hypothetical protein JAAARDRAFT_166317 [Jaapia argillacea MUCL 33604]|uniref:Uncharacterized protein n=1 Tax=Jaapia argillacea MUCL 33604 TaxID=933084 RepID=A0A067QNP1_9AGAM|nr:hypothetical protein JAAARDRAFT_166317 [Jaapia argillacea MUCL 33604]
MWASNPSPDPLQSSGITTQAFAINADASRTECPGSIWPDTPYKGNSYSLLNCSQQDAPVLIQILVDYSNSTQSSIATDTTTAANFFMTQASFNPSPVFFTEEMLQSMSTFPMRRDVHLRGTCVFGVRRVIQQSWKDILGVGANYIEFKTFSFNNLVADTTSNYPPNTSSLLFSADFDTTNTVFCRGLSTIYDTGRFGLCWWCFHHYRWIFRHGVWHDAHGGDSWKQADVTVRCCGNPCSEQVAQCHPPAISLATWRDTDRWHGYVPPRRGDRVERPR